ncbi:MAG: hypothetical protein AB3X44_00235 [Leptothrix sp. (in: b-proteobacteria)]
MEANANETTVDLRQPLIEIVIESWRMAKLFHRLLGKLEVTDSSRYINQIRYFQKRVDDTLAVAGLRLVSLEGYPYDPGMAVTPLNISDFGPEDTLVVEQMLEPILMGPDGVVKSGTILLKLAE